MGSNDGVDDYFGANERERSIMEVDDWRLMMKGQSTIVLVHQSEREIDWVNVYGEVIDGR